MCDIQHKVTLSINVTLHNDTLPLCRVSHFIHYNAERHYAECCCAECRYAVCRYTECCGAIQSDTFSTAMPSVIMLNVVVLNVAAPTLKPA